MSKTKERQFQNDIEYRTYRIMHFAEKHGWQLISDQAKIFRFQNKDSAILEINYFSLDVQTQLKHPRWGDTNLLRKGKLTMKLIEAIFRNPREHMPKDVKSQYLKNISISAC